MYEVFEHTADLGLRVQADSLEELFAEAGRALTSLIVARYDAVQPVDERTIDVAGDWTEPDLLLFDWLNELLFRFETERLLFRDFTVQKTEEGLHAIVVGERLAPERHEPDHEVKAITYHGLRVVHDGAAWQAEIIVDI